jgi:hypothetical protein
VTELTRGEMQYLDRMRENPEFAECAGIIAKLEAGVARLTRERDEAFNRGANEALDAIREYGGVLTTDVQDRYPRPAPEGKEVKS